jgi:biopolymer transport protein ExbD
VRFAWARQRRDSIAVDITPMIDVVFLLIIFFMTTAQYALLTRTELDLPKEKGEQREEAEEAGLVVNITSDGQLIVSAAAEASHPRRPQCVGGPAQSRRAGAAAAGGRCRTAGHRGAEVGIAP